MDSARLNFGVVPDTIKLALGQAGVLDLSNRVNEVLATGSS